MLSAVQAAFHWSPVVLCALTIAKDLEPSSSFFGGKFPHVDLVVEQTSAING